MSDLIDRQAAIDALRKEDPNCGVDAERIIRKLPSVQPDQKTAVWGLRSYMPHSKYCTYCKKDSPYNKAWDYCPNCGAKMDFSV